MRGVVGARGRLDLRADCSRCAALCCVVLPFTRSADFAIDKPAGVPCPNLGGDLGCTIHSTLRADGFRGCAAFDCFGAGQRATELADGDPAVFATLRVLHELLWYLDDALRWAPADEVYAARVRTSELASRPVGVDAVAQRASVAPVLRAASSRVRRPGTRRFGDGVDLAGATLAGAVLDDEDLRGSCLIGADLSGASLARTDLLGADLRGAQLAGADLSSALYVTASQLGAASGDARTLVPPRLDRPTHWR